MNPRYIFYFIALIWSGFAAADESAPLSAEATASGAIAPEGFSVDVIASEPEIGQPIAMAWDTRGRLWLAECHTYADRSLNYDLTQSDRIVVLEDRDADGSFETRTVFAENLQRLTGIEVGLGGVWALTSPTMVFIPDANGDLIPDGPAETMLDGFDINFTRHTIVNGLKWGPDGWLYGRHGIVTISQIGRPGAAEDQRLGIDTGIWRYDPKTEKVEAWTRGGTNPWGHDWSAEGDLFYINTVIGHFWHGIPGAYTERMFGQHERPYLYRLLEMHADHWHFDINGSWTDTRDDADAEDAFGGGHAHTGLMIYQADKWPVEFRDDVFTLNFHGRRINREALDREGSGFVAKHRPDLVKFPDRWFRGIDLMQGPDGDVYVLDWSDTGECHDHDGIDRNSGRIYRVRYGAKQSGPVEPPTTPEMLEAWLRHPNVWYARQARLLIQEKQRAGDLTEAWRNHLRDWFKQESDPVMAIRFLHALNAAGISNPGNSVTDAREAVQARAIQLLADHPLDTPNNGPISTAQLIEVAESGGARARLGLASLLPRLAPDVQLDVATRLLSHGEDAEDHNYPWMLWYAIEPIVASADEDHLSALLDACKIPQLSRYMIRRLAEDYEENRALISRLILARPEFVGDYLAGLSDALEGLPKAPSLPDWEAVMKLAQEQPIVDQLGALFGDGRSLESLFALANDPEMAPESRRQAISFLAGTDYPDLKGHLMRWIDEDQLTGVCATALAPFSDLEVGRKISGRYVYMKAEERAAALDVLVSRAEWANLLLTRIARKQMRPEALTANHARRIVQLGDEALTARLTELWGEVKPIADDAAAEELAEQLRQLITPEGLQQADPSAGRAIFAERCASCHQLYGAGVAIGPDLTGSGRHDLAYLIENVLYPSAIVPAAYRLSVLKLKDGRTLSGMITASGDKRVTLQMVGAPEPIYLSPSEIVSTETMSQSLMPPELIQDLKENQLRDLFGYLMGDHQAPLKP